MNPNPIEAILSLENVARINNAVIEEVSCQGSQRSILISYSTSQRNPISRPQSLRLNITPRTIILNSSGENVNACSLSKGTRISTVFSANMTRSIPPQSNALLILVHGFSQSPAPAITTGRISSIDTRNRILYTGNPNNPSSQTRFIITDDTLITNRQGLPIPLSLLRTGQMVRITHSAAQTASIPPQTTAYRIQVL